MVRYWRKLHQTKWEQNRQGKDIEKEILFFSFFNPHKCKDMKWLRYWRKLHQTKWEHERYKNIWNMREKIELSKLNQPMKSRVSRKCFK